MVLNAVSIVFVEEVAMTSSARNRDVSVTSASIRYMHHDIGVTSASTLLCGQ